MRYKDICQWIHREAEKIPADEYFALCGYYEPKKDKNGHLALGEWTAFPVNHARRLKSIWNRTKDFNQLNNYFKSYGLELSYTP